MVRNARHADHGRERGDIVACLFGKRSGRSSDSLRIVLVPHCRPPESHLGRSDRASRVNRLPGREPEFKSNNLSLNVVWRSWGARARSNRAASHSQ